MLYAEAVAAGEVTASTRLGDLLTLGDAPAGRVTVGSLVTHRSGLPRLPPAAQPLRRTLGLWRHGTNPYGETLDELLAQARKVRVGRPKPRYSNFGFELLGHALAAAAGTAYTGLVAQRIAAPLGLSTLYAPATPSDLRPTALIGALAARITTCTNWRHRSEGGDVTTYRRRGQSLYRRWRPPDRIPDG